MDADFGRWRLAPGAEHRVLALWGNRFSELVPAGGNWSVLGCSSRLPVPAAVGHLPHPAALGADETRARKLKSGLQRQSWSREAGAA